MKENEVTEDYMDEEGCLHCGICGKRKQMKVSLMGFEHVVSCLCECEVKARQELDEKMQREEAQRQLYQRKSVGLRLSLIHIYSKTYQKPGTKVKVTGNMKFYPVTEKVSGVNLRLNNGKVWKVVSTTDVKKATFPSVNMRNGNMCLGWSRRKGKTSNPEYKAGDPIPTKSGNYYMVVFNKKMDIAPSYIREPEKFDKVYLVGDSRTVAYHEVMKSSIPSNVEIIAAGGQGLDWFKTTGYGQLRRQTSRAYQSDRKVKQAVVINLGVNDLKSYSEYVSYMKKAAKTLKRYNCTMYYMSVNQMCIRDRVCVGFFLCGGFLFSII